MLIRDTENFKPGDPTTHVEFKRGEDLGGKVLIILTPDGQLVPYSPKDHNDATQVNGIREGFTVVSMSCRTYYTKTLDKRNLQKGSINPTQEEIDILFSSEIDMYVARGFDPNKGDANTKWDAKLGHTRKTEILVLKRKIFGAGYEPYIPSQHGINAVEFKSLTVDNYRTACSRARTKYDKWLEKKNNPAANSNTASIPRTLRNPTQAEIDIFLSPGIDAYVADSFDPSKGNANTKWNTRLGHTKNTEILVLKKKMFGHGYEPYKPSQHGTNADEFQPITVNNYRTTRTAARKAYDKWLMMKNSPAANSITAPIPAALRNPTQAEIDMFLSSVIDAYVTEDFDPAKGDANTKWDVKVHTQHTEILVLKKKIFGGGYEPYEPSQHGENADEFKSITVKNYRTTRTAARKAYELWKNNNPISTSTTTTTSSGTITSPTPSNQYIGPKRFNPILLINDYDPISETREQETDNGVTVSQIGNAPQQRKRTADDSVLNSTPSFTSSSFALFQYVDDPVVPKDPTEPKRLRLD